MRKKKSLSVKNVMVWRRSGTGRTTEFLWKLLTYAVTLETSGSEKHNLLKKIQASNHHSEAHVRLRSHNICDQFLPLAKVTDKLYRESVKIFPSKPLTVRKSCNSQKHSVQEEWTSLATCLWTFWVKITVGLQALCKVCHGATRYTWVPLVGDEMLRKPEGEWVGQNFYLAEYNNKR